MKDYRRLTKWSELGTLHVFDINGKEVPLCDVSPIDTDNLAGRLAYLEDKIEAGTLIEIPKEVVIYTPNVVLTTEERAEEMRPCNEERKQVVKDVLLTMLDRMDRLTGCGVPYHVKKFINEIAIENGIELVKEDEE